MSPHSIGLRTHVHEVWCVNCVCMVGKRCEGWRAKKSIRGEATGETCSSSCSLLGLTHETVYVSRRSSQTGLQEICRVQKGFSIFPIVDYNSDLGVSFAHAADVKLGL